MFYYERLTAVSSVPEKIVRYREVSTRRKGGSVSFYSRLLGGGVCYLFILVSHLGIHQLPTKHPRDFEPTKCPRKKFSDPRNNHKKNFGSTKYPREKRFGHTRCVPEKILEPRKHDGTMARDSRDPRNSAYLIETKTRVDIVLLKCQGYVNTADDLSQSKSRSYAIIFQRHPLF